MADLLIKAQRDAADGCVTRISPERAGWSYVGFTVYNLSPGQMVKVSEDDCETCVVILTGQVDIFAGAVTFDNVGQRMSVFEKTPPYAAYVPPNDPIAITARTPALIAFCTAPSENRREARLITPDQMRRERRGEGTNTRFVVSILAGENDADRLIIFEVTTPGGHWSSYPPHKHDQNNIPTESLLEETYFHKISPPQGFAFQRVYTDERDIDETMTVHDGDTVLVPRGYHPVGAPHGYDNYYLNVMAGPERKWIFKNDPDHEWIFDKKTWETID